MTLSYFLAPLIVPRLHPTLSPTGFKGRSPSHPAHQRQAVHIDATQTVQVRESNAPCKRTHRGRVPQNRPNVTSTMLHLKQAATNLLSVFMVLSEGGQRQEDMDTTTQTSFIHFIHLFKLNKFLSAWHEGPFILKCLDKKQCSSTFKCRQIIWKSPQKKAQCSESLYRSSLKVIKVFDGAVQISKRPLSYVNEEELWSTFQLSTNTDFVVSLRVQRGH